MSLLLWITVAYSVNTAALENSRFTAFHIMHCLKLNSWTLGELKFEVTLFESVGIPAINCSQWSSISVGYFNSLNLFVLCLVHGRAGNNCESVQVSGSLFMMREMKHI
jgi:hypothetical protein